MLEVMRSPGTEESRNNSGLLRHLILMAAVFWFSCASALPAETPVDRMFERLKGLVGDWEGTYEWSQGRAASGQLKASYYLTGNGSALVENLIMEGVPTMTTVYHLDGADLRMTHYCAARNQPRLKASRIDEAAGEIEFSFVDVTNTDPKGPGYVSGFRIQLPQHDQLNLRFTFAGGAGKGPVENIVLKRAGPAHS
jgi:hypothetical protein